MYITFYDKRDFVDGIKRRISRWGNSLHYPGGDKPSQRSLKEGGNPSKVHNGIQQGSTES